MYSGATWIDPTNAIPAAIKERRSFDGEYFLQPDGSQYSTE
jgi:hypothetical protein